MPLADCDRMRRCENNEGQACLRTSRVRPQLTPKGWHLRRNGKREACGKILSPPDSKNYRHFDPAACDRFYRTSPLELYLVLGPRSRKKRPPPMSAHRRQEGKNTQQTACHIRLPDTLLTAAESGVWRAPRETTPGTFRAGIGQPSSNETGRCCRRSRRSIPSPDPHPKKRRPWGRCRRSSVPANQLRLP